jgi:hypothetical protein
MYIAIRFLEDNIVTQEIKEEDILGFKQCLRFVDEESVYVWPTHRQRIERYLSACQRDIEYWESYLSDSSPSARADIQFILSQLAKELRGRIMVNPISVEIIVAGKVVDHHVFYCISEAEQEQVLLALKRAFTHQQCLLSHTATTSNA